MVSETCRQEGCANPAGYRYTWPGRDESFVCEKHSEQLRGVAAALGCHVQLIALSELRKFKPPLGEWYAVQRGDLFFCIGLYGSLSDAERAAQDLNRVTPRLSLPDSAVIHPESSESQKP